MRLYILFTLILFCPFLGVGQDVIIQEGGGIGSLKIGQTFEEVVNILGFGGDLKTYDDYLAEELFNEDEKMALECVIGFEYYVKYEHLLTLPVSYVFFNENILTQIKVSSFPQYYFSIAKDTKTKKGIDFWTEQSELIRIYGQPDLEVNYENFILDTYFYFEDGIALSLRDDNYRQAHIFAKPTQEVIKNFSSTF